MSDTESDLADLDEIEPLLDPGRQYSIEFKILKQSHKVRLETRAAMKSGVGFVPINKIRLQYFFCNGRENLEQFLDKQ